MAVNIQLKQFAVKATPVGADIIYMADSANNFDEVQCTLNSVIANFPGLLFTWSAVSGTTQAMVPQNGYITTNSGLTTFSLPASIGVGQLLSVQGFGSGGWLIQAGARQNIQVGSSSSSTAGSIASTNQYDSAQFICVVANTTIAALGGPQSAGLTYV